MSRTAHYQLLADNATRLQSFTTAIPEATAPLDPTPASEPTKPQTPKPSGKPVLPDDD